MASDDRKDRFHALKEHIQHTVVGQDNLVERLLIAVLADGHLLVEGLPGLAKTTAVRTLAAGTALSFRRIQFTPDLIPGDVTGTDVYLPGTAGFQFAPGPIFHEVILADEINRAPPKVQSALLEAMAERQVTVGGETRRLPSVFLVMATQNPLEHEGVYPLPEAQLDRFLLKVDLDYPSADEELEILQRETHRQRLPAAAAEPVVGGDDILAARTAVNDLYMDPMLERYIVTLVGATRAPDPWDPQAGQWLSWGASPRATLALARASRARAFLAGRDFVEPGDIAELVPDVISHRIGLSFAARGEGISPRQVVTRLVEQVPIP